MTATAAQNAYSDMKTAVRILLAIALCAIATAATAETHYKPHISIGGRAGMTMSKVSFSPSVKQLWNNGTSRCDIPLYRRENFRSHSRTRLADTRVERKFRGVRSAYSHSLTYVRLPLLTHIYFGSPRFKCFINLGPSSAI